MSETFGRVWFRDVTPGLPVGDLVPITGYIARIEPNIAPLTREVLRPINPDEPDQETEVAYSRNALKPTTLVYKDREIELTLILYKMFRYVYDLCRTEGQTEFEFSEISEMLTGDQLKIGKSAIESNVRRLRNSLTSINAPVDITFDKEKVYIEVKGDI